MPHLTVSATESQLAGRETALIAALTDAVVAVYGEWARPLVVAHLIAVPGGRWGVGGHVVDAEAAPEVRFGIRAGALTGPAGIDVARRLVAAVTDAVAEHLRETVLVELVPQPDDQVGVGGILVSDARAAN